MKTVKITKEDLTAFGMKETEGSEKLFFPMRKDISIPNESGDELGSLSICVTNQRNKTELCLLLPDGGCLYLAPESMEKLKVFEECIIAYEPEY